MNKDRLDDHNFLRYQRQLSLIDIGESGQVKLGNAHILVIGCGGLGCAASSYLAAAGVGRLVLCDDDNVELSNLPRQLAYREQDIGKSKVSALAQHLKSINPLCNIRTNNKRMDDHQLTIEVMLADVVLDCSDNFTTRQQLNRICCSQKRTLISGAAIGWRGQFAVYRYHADSACYHCLVKPEQVSGASALRCSDAGIVGPVVGTIGSMQATAAISQIVDPQLVSGQTSFIQLDGKSMNFSTITIDKDSDCEVCSCN